MNQSIKSLKRLEISEGIITIILGLLLAIFPGFWAGFISILFGGLILVIGIVLAVNSFLEKKYKDFPIFKLIAGCVMAITGITFIFYTSVPISIFAIVVGIIALVYGAVKITTAFYMKKDNNPWFFSLIEGIINSGFGIFMIINPLTGVDIWLIALGIYLVYVGICFIIVVQKSEFTVINDKNSFPDNL